jgi:hypothetical protein
MLILHRAQAASAGVEGDCLSGLGCRERSNLWTIRETLLSAQQMMNRVGWMARCY